MLHLLVFIWCLHDERIFQYRQCILLFPIGVHENVILFHICLYWFWLHSCLDKFIALLWCTDRGAVLLSFWRFPVHRVMKFRRNVYISPAHYIDVIMTAMTSQITSLTVVYSIVNSGANQSKHQSSASLAFVRGIHRDRWIPRTKGQ